MCPTTRPTWTPVGQVFLVATPTLDATRFPGVVLPGAAENTPQVLVPGSDNPIFVPVPADGVTGVQTLVVVVVTATPQPTQTWTPGPPTPTPLPTFTPGPPTATPTATGTPLPPVKIEVTVDQHGLVVADNGLGMSPEVVTRFADLETRQSGRAYRIGPSRGQQGNGLQTALVLPFVLDGQVGRAEIISGGWRHELTLTLNRS